MYLKTHFKVPNFLLCNKIFLIGFGLLDVIKDFKGEKKVINLYTNTSISGL